MSKAIENLQAAQERAMAKRPKVGGFPYLAEALRQAGVTRNLWFLPACLALYLTEHGPVISVDAQAGQSTFPEFLAASWRAGVVRYDVDFASRCSPA